MTTSRPDEARRPSGSRPPYKMYYIFSEGEKTESMYFNSLAVYDKKKKEIEIKVMDRWTVNKGNSNQYQITKEVEKYIKGITTLDPANLLILNELAEKIIAQEISVSEFLKLVQLVSELKNDEYVHENEGLLQQINTVLTMSHYEENYDQIYIILDRDKHSFVEFQYDEVVRIAEDNNYKLGISTPSFEFFLLLHLSDLKEYDPIEIFENARAGKKRFLENILNEKCKENSTRYAKNNYDCNFFLDKYKTGHTNSMHYETNVIELKNQPGTSLFTLLNDLIET